MWSSWSFNLKNRLFSFPHLHLLMVKSNQHSTSIFKPQFPVPSHPHCVKVMTQLPHIMLTTIISTFYGFLLTTKWESNRFRVIFRIIRNGIYNLWRGEWNRSLQLICFFPHTTWNCSHILQGVQKNVLQEWRSAHKWTTTSVVVCFWPTFRSLKIPILTFVDLKLETQTDTHFSNISKFCCSCRIIEFSLSFINKLKAASSEKL